MELYDHIKIGSDNYAGSRYKSTNTPPDSEKSKGRQGNLESADCVLKGKLSPIQNKLHIDNPMRS